MIKKLMTARRFIAAGVMTAFMFVGIASLNAQAPPVPDNGWIFSEQGGETAGATFGDAGGTLSGGVEWSTEDPFGAGGSVSFDGSDGTVVMEDLAEAFNDLANFSLSMWIKANSTGIDRGFWEAVDSGGGDLWGLRYDSTGASAGGSDVIKLGITTSESGGNNNRGEDQQESHEGTQTTEWQHIVMTWEDGEGFNLYIDGVLDEPTLAMVTTGGTTALMDRFVLGDGAKAYWDGYIDEVAVWTSTLTADDAAWLAENSIAGLGGVAGNPLLTGLVAHFPLDEDGNSTNGEFTASTVTDVEFGSDGATANTGTSATFNGSSSIIQHDWVAGLNPEDSFTLSVWAKSDGGAGAWHSPVTSRNDLNPDSQGYIIYDNEPAGAWTFWSGNGTDDGNWQTLDGPEATLGEWEHLTIVYDDDAKTKKLYVNGELAVESDDSVAENDTKPFNIGAGGDTGTAYFFKGDIDDLALWSRALSASEVSDVHANGIPKGPSTLTNGLAGYWPLDDGSGTTAANSAGGEDAQLYNGVEWVDDPDRGSVLSFDGVDGYADAGAETIPQMTQDNDFTWSVWTNQGSGNGANNVVLGNRYSPGGGDFAPREFIKFTPTKFEFHLDGGGQNCEFEDLVEGEWIHHVVVKTGNTLTHYTNGVEDESSTFTSELQNPQPLYFGGDQANENWSGMLDDIAIWDRALSGAEVAELNADGITFIVAARGLEDGLIGFWPFDDKLEATKDISESGNEGTVNGGAEFVTGHTGGSTDSAIQFDGEDDSVTTEVSLLNDLEELTLSFWMLMPEQQGGNRVGLIGQNDAVEYGMINPTTMQYWTPAGSINAPYGPTVDEWTHVAVVVDGDGMRVYSAGEMIAENVAGGAVSSGDTFNMGGDGVFDADRQLVFRFIG